MINTISLLVRGNIELGGLEVLGMVQCIKQIMESLYRHDEY